MVVKANELTKLIKRKGCYLERQGTRHEIWVNPKTGGKSQIPRHPGKEVPTGTVNRILKDLGLK